MASAVTKNMIVRVGGDFSGLISASKKGADGVESSNKRIKKSVEDMASKSALSAGKSVGAFDGIASSVSGLFSSAKRFDGAASIFSSGFAKLIGGISIGALVSKAIDAASDLSEVQNVVDTAFGTMSGAANAFAETEAEMFGLSELQAKQFSGRYMAMASSLGIAQKEAAGMSIELTKLSGDVASFYNLSQDEAYSKLKGVFTGETEALKDLGVVMTQANLNQYALSQGIQASVKDLPQAEQAILRYGFVTQALSDASGDFAKTSTSWANNIRTLQNRSLTFLSIIGKGFIAIANPIVTGLNAALGAINTFASAVSDVLSDIFGTEKSERKGGISLDTAGLMDGVDDALGGIASGADDAASGVSGVGSAAKDASDGVKDVGDAAKKTKKDVDALTSFGFDKFNVLRKAADAASDATNKDKKKTTSGKTGTGAASADLSSITAGIGDNLFGQAAENVGAVSGALEGLRGYLSGLDFKPLKEGFEKLKTGAGAVAEVIKGGLAWGLENVLAPLGKWTIEKALPSAMNLFGAGLQLVADAATALSPVVKAVWDGFFKPLFTAIGNLAVDALDGITGVFDFLDGLVTGDFAKMSEGASEMFNAGVNIIKDLFGGMLSIVTANPIGKWLWDHLWGPMVDGIKGLFSGDNLSDTPLLDAALKIGGGILNAIATPFKALGNWAGEHILTPLKNGISSGMSLAGEKISVGIELAKSGWTTVSKWVSSAWGTISSAAVGLAKSGWTTVSKWVSSAWGTISSAAVGLAKSGWTTVSKWVSSAWGTISSAAVGLAKSGWTTVSKWVSSAWGTISSAAVGLAKKGWTTVSGWIGNIPSVSQVVGLAKSGWSSVKKWVGDIPGVSQAVGLAKSGWSSVNKWIGDIPGVSQAVGLAKSGWSSIKKWIGDIPGVSQAVGLAKSGWSTVKKWIGDIPSVSQVVGLAKSGWSTVGAWVKSSIGSAVNFSIGLAKGWTGSVAKALGLDNLASKFEIKIPKVSVAWEGAPIALPKFSVKWNAHGGILSGAQLFGMAGNTMLGGGEAGLEAVLPLEQNTRWMDLIFNRWQEIQSQSSMRVATPAENQRPIIVNITTTLDGQVVARNTVNYVRNETRATGVSPLRGAI